MVCLLLDTGSLKPRGGENKLGHKEMSLTINHNLMASNTARNLSTHYGSLGVSTRRLSSGLRIGTAADDAAGLAVREMMRADIVSYTQGVRNANDGISMIQVADGALQVIDEKLIRMKELATQAATGTYTSDQRAIIDDEFQAMASEIQRISMATDFNGIKLLDGNLSGDHNGAALNPTGAMQIHFGSGNSELKDFYRLQIESTSLLSLGLAYINPEIPPTAATPIDQVLPYNTWTTLISGIRPIASIPALSTNINIELNNYSLDDDLQIFTRSGVHLAGTGLSDFVWGANGINSGNVDASFLTEENGFLQGAAYDSSYLIDGRSIAYNNSSLATSNAYNSDMTISYGGDGDIDNDGEATNPNNIEIFHVDFAREELLVFSVGTGSFEARATWGTLGGSQIGNQYSPYIPYSVSTQELAQSMLERVNNAVIKKDKIRASLGATQNRLENTITNLEIQAENLQAAEARISDADMATEMTEFVKSQILTQSATAMLAQANALPEMALQLIQGQRS